MSVSDFNFMSPRSYSTGRCNLNTKIKLQVHLYDRTLFIGPRNCFYHDFMYPSYLLFQNLIMMFCDSIQTYNTSVTILSSYAPTYTCWWTLTRSGSNGWFYWAYEWPFRLIQLLWLRPITTEKAHQRRKCFTGSVGKLLNWCKFTISMKHDIIKWLSEKVHCQQYFCSD